MPLSCSLSLFSLSIFQSFSPSLFQTFSLSLPYLSILNYVLIILLLLLCQSFFLSHSHYLSITLLSFTLCLYHSHCLLLFSLYVSLSLCLSVSLSLSLSLWPPNISFCVSYFSMYRKRSSMTIHSASHCITWCRCSRIYMDVNGSQRSFIHYLDFGRVHVYDHPAWGLSISEQTKVWDGTHRSTGMKVPKPRMMTSFVCYGKLCGKLNVYESPDWLI